jgi:hypothetical protein
VWTRYLMSRSRAGLTTDLDHPPLLRKGTKRVEEDSANACMR